MSKHNYSQHYNKPKPEVTNEANDEAVKPVPISEPVLVNETVETVALPNTVTGIVVDCAKLNVRAEANLFADVICTLDSQSEIEINIDKSNKDWFHICTATGVEGYCMRKYVEAHL